jgi:hypothetical protein
VSTTFLTPAIAELEEIYNYEAPEIIGMDDVEQSHVAQFVAVIAVILAFWLSVLAWCYFVCRNSGGLASCDVGWFKAKATCRR